MTLIMLIIVNMTLADLYNWMAQNPMYILGYIGLVPFFTGIIALFRSQANTVKAIISIFLYSISIPVLLNTMILLYLIIFENKSLMSLNFIFDILPIVSLIATIFIINKYYDISTLPWFGKLYGLFLMLGSLFVIMIILEKTRLIIFSMLPFKYIFFLFIIIMVAMRVAWKKMRFP